MAARSIASLTVSFGLVSIPVKLFSATEASRAISFNLLHKACGSRLKQQYLCIKEEVPVAREDMVKGYEFAKDQYVIFSPEELKALEEAGTHMAESTEAAVQKKVEGEEITLAEAPEGGAQVIDLMEALRASLEKKAPARAKAPGPELVTRKPPKRAQTEPTVAAVPAARKGVRKKA